MKYRVILPLSLTAAMLVPAGTAAAASESTNLAATTIATVSSSDFRAELVAHRVSSGRAPTASATLTAYRHVGHGWRRLMSRRLAATFFWKTLIGPRSICRFELASTGHAHVTVQLLQSPALGCSPSQSISLEE